MTETQDCSPSRNSTIRTRFTLATRPVGSNLEITFALPKPGRTGRAPKSRLEKEQIQKRRSAEASARYYILKESGLCTKCSNKAVEGKARCPACAEKHRRYELDRPKRKR